MLSSEAQNDRKDLAGEIRPNQTLNLTAAAGSVFHTPSDLVVESFSCSLISSRSGDLQIEQPVVCR
jgi:hypothetical protein